MSVFTLAELLLYRQWQPQLVHQPSSRGPEGLVELIPRPLHHIELITSPWTPAWLTVYLARKIITCYKTAVLNQTSTTTQLLPKMGSCPHLRTSTHTHTMCYKHNCWSQLVGTLRTENCACGHEPAHTRHCCCSPDVPTSSTRWVRQWEWKRETERDWIPENNDFLRVKWLWNIEEEDLFVIILGHFVQNKNLKMKMNHWLKNCQAWGRFC